MTKAEFITAVAEKAGLTKKDADAALSAVIDTITDSLAKGDKIQLVGFGTFEVRERKAREGINPRTKEKIAIASAKVPAFKAGRALKDPFFILKGEKYMRLDKYLKVSRLIKRRTVANEACDADKISVNGKIARASYDVKVGDEIEINMGKTPLKVKVMKVVEVVGKDGASELYSII